MFCVGEGSHMGSLHTSVYIPAMASIPGLQQWQSLYERKQIGILLIYCLVLLYSSDKLNVSSGVSAPHTTYEGTFTVTRASTEKAVTCVTLTEMDKSEALSANRLSDLNPLLALT